MSRSEKPYSQSGTCSGKSRESSATINLPVDMQPLALAFRRRLIDLLGENLYGIYLYGALTFPDSREIVQDIDFHVILGHGIDDEMRTQIELLHDDLARDFPGWGSEMDGYYIALADTHRLCPPPHQLWPASQIPTDTAWALHCAHIRAGQYINLFGPDPLGVYPVPDWPALEAALFDEVRFVDAHLDDPAYCVLNACRLQYSFHTRDVVVSKLAAATWALQHVPHRWHELVHAAHRSYRKRKQADDDRLLHEEASTFVRATWVSIAARG